MKVISNLFFLVFSSSIAFLLACESWSLYLSNIVTCWHIVWIHWHFENPALKLIWWELILYPSFLPPLFPFASFKYRWHVPLRYLWILSPKTQFKYRLVIENEKKGGKNFRATSGLTGEQGAVVHIIGRGGQSRTSQGKTGSKLLKLSTTLEGILLAAYYLRNKILQKEQKGKCWVKYSDWYFAEWYRWFNKCQSVFLKWSS